MVHTLLGISSGPNAFLALVQTRSTAVSISATVNRGDPSSASWSVTTSTGSCENSRFMILPTASNSIHSVMGDPWPFSSQFCTVVQRVPCTAPFICFLLILMAAFWFLQTCWYSSTFSSTPLLPCVCWYYQHDRLAFDLGWVISIHQYALPIFLRGRCQGIAASQEAVTVRISSCTAASAILRKILRNFWKFFKIFFYWVWNILPVNLTNFKKKISKILQYFFFQFLF